MHKVLLGEGTYKYYVENKIYLSIYVPTRRLYVV